MTSYNVHDNLSGTAAASTNGAAPAEEAIEPSLGPIPEYPVDALPGDAQALVHYGERQGLPPALVAGAALAATATAIGNATEIKVAPSWHQRAIIWIPLLAPRGAGKSPSQTLAFAPMRERDEQNADDDADGDTLLLGDQTLEALARSLAALDGAAGIDLDELSVLLRGLGEYKRGPGGDRGRFLGLWSGGPWRFARVGGKGGKQNAVSLRIDRPTLVICGGLQSAIHDLLGSDEDGLRPRWLPHLAGMPDPPAAKPDGVPADLQAVSAWEALLDRLIANRKRPTTRELTPGAHARFEHHRREWKAQARDRAETASTTAALIKADIHLARIALVLYETDPDRRDRVGEDHVDRAARIVEFVLDCWRALPEQGSLALSRRDEVLDRGIGKLIPWLEEHGGQATVRDLLRAHVAGVRTASDLGALLERYEASYPGAITRGVKPSGGGTPTTIVRAPIRGGV
jgi:hypothetical protein